jgi:hypothetical protein
MKEKVKVNSPVELPPVPPVAPEIEMSISGEANLKVLVPEENVRLSGMYTSSLSGGNSPSPTSVSQRSRKSVTFNPISTVKEYCRDSASIDKDFTTYIISQLGCEDNWSDDESDNMDEGRERRESDDADYYSTIEGEYEYSEGSSGMIDLRLNQVNEESPYTDAQSNEDAELLLLGERIIDENHPEYIVGFDFDYEEHKYGIHGDEQRRLARYRVSSGLCHSPESCVWVCSS